MRHQTPLACPQCEKLRKRNVDRYWRNKAARDAAARKYYHDTKPKKDRDEG